MNEAKNPFEKLKNKEPLTVSDILDLYPFLGIPHFQRGLVWGSDSVSSLLESLYYGTPCGSFVFWKARSNSDDGESLPIEENTTERNIEYLIVDGQQRIRSLYGAFRDWYLNVEDDQEVTHGSTEKQQRIWLVNLCSGACPFLS